MVPKILKVFQCVCQYLHPKSCSNNAGDSVATLSTLANMEVRPTHFNRFKLDFITINMICVILSHFLQNLLRPELLYIIKLIWIENGCSYMYFRNLRLNVVPSYYSYVAMTMYISLINTQNFKAIGGNLLKTQY